MLNNSRFPNWYWKKVKGMPRSNKVIPILVVLRKSAYIHLLHLLIHALIFLKAQLWSPSIKVLQSPQLPTKLRTNPWVSHSRSSITWPPYLHFLWGRHFQMSQSFYYFCRYRLPSYCCFFNCWYFATLSGKTAPNLWRACSLFLTISWFQLLSHHLINV